MSHILYHDTGSDSLSDKKHYHDYEFEILHIISGEGTITINDRLYPITPQTIFFIRGNEAHCSSPKNPLEYRRSKLVFSKEKLYLLSRNLCCENMINSLFVSGGCAVKLSVNQSSKIDEYILKIKEQENDKNRMMHFFINLFLILDLSLRSKENTVEPIKNKVSEIMEYINKNIEKNLSLDIISNELHVNKYYLCHSFKKASGMTVFEYITFVRISKAKQLLLKTTKSISEISLEVGFDNFAYFSKTFKKYEGITPMQYRKKG